MFIKDVEAYKGEDLIILTGPPGCRWSGVARAISTNVNINTSDERTEFEYSNPLPEDSDPDNNGWHRGVYWGPFHKYGKEFDKLDQLSKEEILLEFQKPFENWEGVKIIKSHWFAYHLLYLKKLFPKAKIVGIYRDTELSFNHWHKVGGWSIEYPHYEWYENDDRMRQQIQLENDYIKQFFGGIPMHRESIEDLYIDLGLQPKMHDEKFLLERDPKYKEFMKKYTTIKNLCNEIAKHRHIGID